MSVLGSLNLPGWLMPFASVAAPEASSEPVVHFGIVFLMLAVVLLAGKLGNVVEKWGLPGVIGELFAGIVLSGLGYFGWALVPQITGNQVMAFMAALGAVLLLFAIGLETRILEMRQVGLSASLVAAIGVVVPFVLGTYVLAPLLFPGSTTNARLFLGASMVATSVGITASVFKSLGIMQRRAAKTVLGAAVIDDVLGLMVLAMVSALVGGGQVSGGMIAVLALKSFGFLGGALLIGSLVANPISNFLSRLHPGVGMKIVLAVSFAFVFAWLAELFGLEPIIGAFAAGLLLEEVHFRRFDAPPVVNELKAALVDDPKEETQAALIIRKHQEAHVEDLINNLGLIFIPVFFVFTGMQINFGSLLQPKLYLLAIVLSVAAIAGKVVAGVAAKGDRREKLLVGVAMVPRGEVGLIFAATGKALGAISDDIFSTIILMVVITTFVAPPLIKKFAPAEAAAKQQ
ncbi:MAG TPA: cation:proton antiporter [Candidatus Saccharimonadales bacterium]|nr:cation:proton antiporter [Candidatus Saccharimonadales bacterium]